MNTATTPGRLSTRAPNWRPAGQERRATTATDWMNPPARSRQCAFGPFRGDPRPSPCGGMGARRSQPKRFRALSHPGPCRATRILSRPTAVGAHFLGGRGIRSSAAPAVRGPCGRHARCSRRDPFRSTRDTPTKTAPETESTRSSPQRDPAPACVRHQGIEPEPAVPAEPSLFEHVRPEPHPARGGVVAPSVGSSIGITPAVLARTWP